MNARRLRIGGAALFAAVLLSSCASTSLLSSWADPASAGKGIDKCMVIGVSDNPLARRKFEDTFVAQLKHLGETAIPSYPLLPDASKIDEQVVAPIVRQNRIDHLVLVRVTDERSVTTIVPPRAVSLNHPLPYYPSYYGSWPGYFAHQYAMVTLPGYTYETKYVNLETNVYDVRSGKLIWSGLTETEIGSHIDAHFQELVQVLTAAMKKDRIL